MLGYLFGNYRGVYGPPFGPISPYPPAAANIGQLTALQQRVDSLEMACAALWKLLKEQNGFTDEQLKTVIHEIDAADGAADGKVTKHAGLCPHCQHRILSRTANKCLWCGAPLDEAPFNVGGAGSEPAG